MVDNSIRWQQRFGYFQKAYNNFAQIAVVDIDALSDLEKEGFVRRFQYTLELAWKTLKDYLASLGFHVTSPKQTIRQAWQSEVINDGEVWMEALQKRNLTSHTYNSSFGVQIEVKN